MNYSPIILLTTPVIGAISALIKVEPNAGFAFIFTLINLLSVFAVVYMNKYVDRNYLILSIMAFLLFLVWAGFIVFVTFNNTNHANLISFVSVILDIILYIVVVGFIMKKGPIN